MYLWCQWVGLNHRPRRYECRALTSWATLANAGIFLFMVAEVWIEHTTSRLWALRATTALLRGMVFGMYFWRISQSFELWLRVRLLYSAIWHLNTPWLYEKIETVNIFFQSFDKDRRTFLLLEGMFFSFFGKYFQSIPERYFFFSSIELIVEVSIWRSWF